MDIWEILGTIVFGAVIGVLARIVLPGKQNISLGWTILGGGIGAFIGGLIAKAFGVRSLLRKNSNA